MSYTVPGTIATTPPPAPSPPPCTGDFWHKLECTSYGWFFYVAIFCVFLVVCALCLCFVVSPIVGLSKQWVGRVRKRSKAVAAVTAAAAAAAAPKGHGPPDSHEEMKENSKPACSKTRHEREHSLHRHPDDALKITALDLGRHRPPAYTVTTPATAGASSSASRPWHPHHKQRSWGRSPMTSIYHSGGSAPSSRRGSHIGGMDITAVAAATGVDRDRRVVVDDPGIGAEATRRGGGWMGAENGRL